MGACLVCVSLPTHTEAGIAPVQRRPVVSLYVFQWLALSDSDRSRGRWGLGPAGGDADAPSALTQSTSAQEKGAWAFP